MIKNSMYLEFPSKSANESFARIAVAAFLAQLDPTLEELTDVKTAVSEAVTNSIVHGYKDKPGYIEIECQISDDNVFEIIITDYGCGIDDVEKAKEPLYTTQPEMERSGMGFTIMESFMDSLLIISEKGMGTTVKMSKKIG